jgi:hypothetical protein
MSAVIGVVGAGTMGTGIAQRDEAAGLLQAAGRPSLLLRRKAISFVPPERVS